MTPFLLAAAVALAPQASAPDRVLLSDRTEVSGDIVGWAPAGRLTLRDPESGREREFAQEEILRIRFGGGEDLPRPAEWARLASGGVLGGRIVSFDGETAVVEGAAGTFKIRRADVQMFLLAATTSPLPALKEGAGDVLIREEGEPKRTLVADHGRLRSIGERVIFEVATPAGGSEKREFDRASVKQIHLQADSAGEEPPPGWFAQATLRNGDRWVGVIRGISGGNVRFFSSLFGAAEVEKKLIRSIVFLPNARMGPVHILICDQAGVREFDRQGTELWSYRRNVQYALSARKLENGNVLIAATNHNQVLEIRPVGRNGGEVAARLEAGHPYDAIRLENGNTLVAEQRQSNRVAEYDARLQGVVWQHPVDGAMSVQRLENGNTLISTHVKVFEVDRRGQEQWKLVADIRPWRVQRLENGNTLVTDFQRGQVVEFDPQANEVWKETGLSKPVHALRLEDGSTLILEQGSNQLIEVDPARGKRIVRVKGLNYPQGMSGY